jgi:hypothetical protein
MVEFELTKEADVLENDDGTRLCRIVAHDSGAEGVAWIHLYATVDRKKSYCIYRAPSPEAIYELAQRKGLTVSAITEIRTLQAIERFDRVA